MPRSKICLPDINVWIALWWEGHTHHLAAKSWYATLERSGAAFCRVSQMGFLRLITNRSVMGGDVLTQKRAWQVYERVAQDSPVLFVAEPDNLETAWKSLTQLRSPAANVWTDAYLAALAGLHGLTVVSFDRSFPKRDGMDCLLLPAGVIH